MLVGSARHIRSRRVLVFIVTLHCCRFSVFKAGRQATALLVEEGYYVKKLFYCKYKSLAPSPLLFPSYHIKQPNSTMACKRIEFLAAGPLETLPPVKLILKEDRINSICHNPRKVSHCFLVFIFLAKQWKGMTQGPCIPSKHLDTLQGQ